MQPQADDVLLPTFSSASWSIASFHDSLVSTLPADTSGVHLRLFFYAATSRGWGRIRDVVRTWSSRAGRHCTVYMGTDHGITDADVIDEIRKTGIETRIMIEYRGVFHPKAVWLESEARHTLWVGSNNLTDGGLSGNIECAVRIESDLIPDSFSQWFAKIHAGSVLATPALIADYQSERDKFVKEHFSGGMFTWSKRREPPAPPPPPNTDEEEAEVLDRPGSLVVQIMPRETGPGGKQVQLPKNDRVLGFFGVGTNVGDSMVVRLRSIATDDTKRLTMTVYQNRTIRLSISELSYSDRPCMMVFTHIRGNHYDFEIVQRAVWPDRHQRLMQACRPPTRVGSRRWAIL